MLLSVAAVLFCFLTSSMRVFHIPHQHSSWFYVLTIAVQTAVGHCLIEDWICVSLTTNNLEITSPHPHISSGYFYLFFFF